MQSSQQDLDQSFVENPSSASATATAAAFGTNVEVTVGSIFKILAGRKALKCPREEPLVNSASATTGSKAEVTGRSIFKPPSLCMDSSAYAYDPSGKMPLKRSLVRSAAVIKGRKKRHCDDPGQSFVENPGSASATTGTKGEVTGGSVFKPPRVDSSAYVYAAPEVQYEFIRVRGRRGKEANKLFTNLYGMTKRRMPSESGIMPPQNAPREMLIDDPFYRKAVASGVEVEVRGSSWSAKPTGGLFYPLGL